MVNPRAYIKIRFFFVFCFFWVGRSWEVLIFFLKKKRDRKENLGYLLDRSPCHENEASIVPMLSENEGRKLSPRGP